MQRIEGVGDVATFVTQRISPSSIQYTFIIATPSIVLFCSAIRTFVDLRKYHS